MSDATFHKYGTSFLFEFSNVHTDVRYMRLGKGKTELLCSKKGKENQLHASVTVECNIFLIVRSR